MDDLNVMLDMFGQQSQMDIYTQICLCFGVDDPALYPLVIDTLSRGLRKLAEGLPWTAGQIVNEGSGDGDTGVYLIKALDNSPELVVRDWRDNASMPSMKALRQRNFPINMLDETQIASRATIPTSEDELKPKPVFAVQANFIRGGLILTFVGQHQAMDMTGQEHLIRLLSKACHGTPFTDEEAMSTNPDEDIIPFLEDPYSPGIELQHQLVKYPPLQQTSEGASATQVSEPVRCIWTNFVLSLDNLIALKNSASASQPSNSLFISTDDAVTALFWQSIMRARLPRLNHASKVKFARAVDMRSLMGVSPMYPGLLQTMAYTDCELETLVRRSLGGVASQLRRSLDAEGLIYQTRSLATYLSRCPDKDTVSFTASLNLSSDIAMSSWAKLHSYTLDFNLRLGNPEAVRRPLFIPVEGLGYLLPRNLDGEMVVALCLREEDMARLKQDKIFAQYARCDG